LTQEGARVALLELPQVTHSVSDRVRGVDGKMEMSATTCMMLATRFKLICFPLQLVPIDLGLAERSILHPRLHRPHARNNAGNRILHSSAAPG
jgi:hypothetical protein